MNRKKTISESIIILVFAFIAGLVYNSISENGVSLIYSPPEIIGKSEIDVETAFELHRTQRALFIDVRYPQEYAAVHIDGAVNISVHGSPDEIEKAMQGLDTDRAIVVYCSTADCNYSERMAGILGFLKYENVLIFKGGLEAWEEAGYQLIWDKE